MGIETWLSLAAAALLGAAAVIHAVLLWRAPASRHWVPAGLRVAAALLLAVALALDAARQGDWLLFDARRAALAVALAMLFLDAALSRSAAGGGARPASDLAALVLIGLSLALGPGAQPSACAARAPAFRVAWGLSLMGGGAAALAGSAGLMAAGLALAGPRHRAPAETPLPRAAGLCLILLGSGLLLGAGWEWRTEGTLFVEHPAPARLAAAWLVEAASDAAWRLGRGAWAWAAGLAILAAALVLFGLLAPAGL